MKVLERMRAARAVPAVLAAAALVVGVAACGDSAGDNGGGATTAGVPKPVAVNKTPTTPFDPNVKPGAKPDLPARLAQTLPAPGELFATLDKGAREGAEGHGLQYISAQANGDSSKQFQQVQDFLARGVGGLIATDLAVPALVPLQRQAIEDGVAVFTAPFAYSTCQGTLDQYQAGYMQGEATVKWIKEELGGKAEVAMFNQVQSPSIRPRDQGVRDALKKGGPGIRLVADVTMRTLSPDEGLKASNTILQQHPNVNAWIGPDDYLMGTLAAVKAAGKDASTTGLFGITGSKQALDEIAKGGMFKATFAGPTTLIAYAEAQYAADWLAGKSIPMVMMFRFVEVSTQADIDAFEQLQASPARAFEENNKSEKYYKRLGNTSYSDNKYLTVVAQ